MVESGPIPAAHGVVRWRLVDLCQWMFEEFRVTIAKQAMSRELRALGYRILTVRPKHHAQAEGAIEEIAPVKVVEILGRSSRLLRLRFLGGDAGSSARPAIVSKLM